MPTTQAAVKARLSTAEWRVLTLLVISIFINYIDRSNLSVAAPLLKQELGLTDYQLGKLLSSFFLTYGLLQLFGLAGWLVNRYSVGVVLATGFFLWSGATALTGILTSFIALYSVRLVLGAGESIAYPCYSKILAGNFPEHHRGLANALIDAGSKMGPALGTLTGGLLMAHFGWRAFFVALGMLSLAWLIPWLAWMPRDRVAEAAQVHKAPTTLEILRHRSAWGTFIGLFCANYFWYFLLTWLPTYMMDARGFSKEKMAWMGSLAYFTIAIASVTAGYTSDRWIARGGAPTRVRKTFTVAGLTVATVILPVASVRDEAVSMALLLIACVAFGAFCSNHWAITQTMAGPRAAGKWTGLQNGVGNLAGITAPWLTGLVVQQTGHYAVAFVLAAAVALVGAIMYFVVIGPVRQVAWVEHG
jgi:MFS transporter, ACS family, D-galactonate transporter